MTFDPACYAEFNLKHFEFALIQKHAGRTAASLLDFNWTRTTVLLLNPDNHSATTVFDCREDGLLLLDDPSGCFVVNVRSSVLVLICV